MVLTSKFAAQPASDHATFAYLCADLDAMVCPTQSNFAKAFESAPNAAAREAVTKCAAKNGIAISVSTPAVSSGLKSGM